jgi:hypothetical protein
MTPRTRKIVALLFAWYVVTTSGQKFMGPFALMSDCNEEAVRAHERYLHVSSFCKSFND